MTTATADEKTFVSITGSSVRLDAYDLGEAGELVFAKLTGGQRELIRNPRYDVTTHWRRQMQVKARSRSKTRTPKIELSNGMDDLLLGILVVEPDYRTIVKAVTIEVGDLSADNYGSWNRTNNKWDITLKKSFYDFPSINDMTEKARALDMNEIYEQVIRERRRIRK